MRHRTDTNQQQLRDAAEQLGWLWLNASQTNLGFDAILVKGGRVVLAEVKDGSKPPSAQQLTPHERDTHMLLERHGVIVELLTCVDDLAVLGRERSGRRGGYWIRGFCDAEH